MRKVVSLFIMALIGMSVSVCASEPVFDPQGFYTGEQSAVMMLRSYQNLLKL